MKILPLITLALLVSFSASSFGSNNYKVLGNYKELDYLVEDLRENSVGVAGAARIAMYMDQQPQKKLSS
jgi:hypothetical protein